MIEAKILLDSVGPNGARLTTFSLTYPRFIHAEIMTHRVFSRNAASSRAIPPHKILDLVEKSPAEPVFWGRNQQGMQAREELLEPLLGQAKTLWGYARDSAVSFVRSLYAVGLHKQLSNRIVEPWMPMTTLVTSTHWKNFFALRRHSSAQPEFHAIANAAYQAFRESTPGEPNLFGWHAPLLPDREELLPSYSVQQILKISVGRLARVSYLTHDGKRDPEADIALCERLLASGHMSPFEHVAESMSEQEWTDFSLRAAAEWIERGIPMGNLWGWRQYRKLLTDESAFPHPEGDTDLSWLRF